MSETDTAWIETALTSARPQAVGALLRYFRNLDEALDVARELGAANPGGAYEIRPVGMFRPGGALT